jgi:hypothetical protein
VAALEILRPVGHLASRQEAEPLAKAQEKAEKKFEHGV